MRRPASLSPVVVLVVSLLFGCMTGLEEPTYAAELKVTGNGTAEVVVKADGHLVLSREDENLPFEHHLSRDYDEISLIAFGKDITCTLVVRGKVVSTQTGDEVSCRYSAKG